MLGLEIAWWQGGHWNSSLGLDTSSGMIQTHGRLPYDSRTLSDTAHRGNCDLWLEWNPWLLWALQWLRMEVKFFNNFEQHTRILGKNCYFQIAGSFFGDQGAGWHAWSPRALQRFVGSPGEEGWGQLPRSGTVPVPLWILESPAALHLDLALECWHFGSWTEIFASFCLI